jgi:3-oxoacyl-[acyl-carrier protein] reductase
MNFEKTINLKNKIIVINSGGEIAYATAKLLAENEGTIILLSRSKHNKHKDFLSNLPGLHQVINVDITKTNTIKEAVEQITKDYGKVDVLINTAGVKYPIHASNVYGHTDEQIDNILITNIRGTFACIREFINLLKPVKGVVINISSTAGQKSTKHNILYGASKAAIDNMTKSLSVALSPDIRIVGVAPGALKTGTNNINRTDEMNEKILNTIPLKRFCNSEDVASIILSIIKDIKYINGTTIVLDGGRTA